MAPSRKKALSAIAIVAAVVLIIVTFIGVNRMSLTWSDEFDGPIGSPPDAQYWTAVVDGQGGGNQEKEYYTPENAALDGEGNLVLTGDRDNGRYTAWYGPSQFTSAKLWTAGKLNFRYGHIEVNAQFPNTLGQPGAWPAIWMLGADFPNVNWPACGEIDIMESFGTHGRPNEVSSAVHTPTDNPAQTYTISDPHAPHTYALDWRPSSLSFSVDGDTFFTVYKKDLKTWPFDKPFFLILNLALGGTMGGDIPDTAVLPYQMKVNWVRVYGSELSP